MEIISISGSDTGFLFRPTKKDEWMSGGPFPEGLVPKESRSPSWTAPWRRSACGKRGFAPFSRRLRRVFPDAHVAGESGFSLHARLRARALRGSFDGFIAAMDSPMTALCYCRRSFRDEAAAAQVFCTGCRIPADSFISKIRKTDWSTCSREMVPCRTASSTAGI